MKRIFNIWEFFFLFLLVNIQVTALSGTESILYSPFITENESDHLFYTYSDGFALDHNIIVWQKYHLSQTSSQNFSSTLRMMNLTNGMTQVLATSPSPEHRYMFDTPFGIADGTVVWLEDFNIFVYDDATREAYALTTDGAHVALDIQRENRDPFISADRIVWAKKKLYPSIDYDIVLYNLSSRTLREISTGSGVKKTPSMDGSRIVWVDKRNEPGDGDIYLFDLEQNEEIPLCTARDLQQYPRISGDYVVWQDYRDGTPAIYLYNLTTKSEYRISDLFSFTGVPYLSGNYVAWTEYAISDRTMDKSRSVFIYNIATGEKELFMQETGRLILLDLNQNRILYADYENKPLKDGFVHLYTIDTPVETPGPALPSQSPKRGNATSPVEDTHGPPVTHPAPVTTVPLAFGCVTLIMWIRNR